MSERENLTPIAEERDVPLPSATSEFSPDHEVETPYYDRLWYISKGQAHLLTIPDELEDGAFNLLFYFAEAPGKNLLGSDLTEELEHIPEIDDLSLTFRVGNLRRWLADDFANPQLIQGFRIERKMAYRFNAERAKMLEVGEAVPTWPEGETESDEVGIFEESDALHPVEKRPYDRFWYRYTTKRNITRETTETLPDNMPDEAYELLDLLTMGSRADSLIQTSLLKREVQERLGRVKVMSVSNAVTWLQDWLGNPNLISQVGHGPGTEYRFNGQAKLLEPEPQREEPSSLAPQSTIFMVPSHAASEPLRAQVPQPEISDPLRRILEGDQSIESTLRTYIGEIYPEMDEKDSWKLSQVVGHFRGFSGAFTHSFIQTAVQSRILNRRALKPEATFNREEVIRLRLFHEHRELLTKMTTKQFHRIVRLVMSEYPEENQDPSGE